MEAVNPHILSNAPVSCVVIVAAFVIAVASQQG